MRSSIPSSLLVAAVLLAGPSRAGEAERRGGKTLADLLAPFESHGHVYDAESVEAMRPRVMGTKGVVATGHYLATLAGIEAFRKGGNAFDAGVTAAMALKTVKMGYAGWTGVAPLVLYSARDDEVVTRVGAGTAPARASLDYFLEHGKNEINLALVPADVDVWIATLDRYGTFRFADAVAPALDLAENGYHLYKHQKGLLDAQQEKIQRFPYNVTFWFQHGIGNQRLGQRMINRDLGRLLRYMIAAERNALARGATRSEALAAARDAFYKGEPARAVDRLYTELGGLVRYEDLAGYEGKWMAPLHTRFRGYDVYVPDGWSQGPRLILFLNLLEDVDLVALGYNTPAYIHLLSQVIDLAMADVHRWVGDPDFVQIPEELYSKDYARKRFALFRPDRAFEDMPPWGDPRTGAAIAPDAPSRFTREEPTVARRPAPPDTSSVNVMDGEGNVFSMTESDGHMATPMVPGWGFGLSDRMEQFNLDPTLANVVAPGKRPRNTNSPVLVLKDGKPFMGLSTPGGDQQLQSLLQILLDVIVWDIPVENALDQPRFGSYNFPATGYEINESPAVLRIEERIPRETFEALAALGHDVQPWGLWNWRACAPTVTYRDPELGVLVAAGDVRRETSALGY